MLFLFPVALLIPGTGGSISNVGREQQCVARRCKLATCSGLQRFTFRGTVNYTGAVSKQLECKSNTSGVTLVSRDPVIYPLRFCGSLLLSEILIWAQHFVNIYPVDTSKAE